MSSNLSYKLKVGFKFVKALQLLFNYSFFLVEHALVCNDLSSASSILKYPAIYRTVCLQV